MNYEGVYTASSREKSESKELRNEALIEANSGCAYTFRRAARAPTLLRLVQQRIIVEPAAPVGIMDDRRRLA